MKINRILTISLLIGSLILSCQKENHDRVNLQGIWINLTDATDSIIIESTIANIKHEPYIYSIVDDTIVLKYGPLSLINCLPIKFIFTLNQTNDNLKIYGLNHLCNANIIDTISTYSKLK
jgi:hypothetical protein